MYLQTQRDHIVRLAFVLGFACVFQFANAQTTTRVSVSSAAIESNDISSRPAISADGRYIVFYSDADNLVLGDSPPFDPDTCPACNGVRDIFVHNNRTGKTVRVSVSSAGVAGNDKSDRPSISEDGRFVAFTSDATNLVSGDFNGERDIFVHDRDTDMDGIFDEPGAISIVRASLAFDQTEANGRCNMPFISGDGRFVAFRSRATNLVSGGTSGVDHVFVRDLQTNSTVLVSLSSAGVAGNGTSDRPYMTSDGRFVSYFSDADNLVVGDLPTHDPNLCPDCPGFRDAFVHDRDPDQNGIYDEGNGATERVSISSGGVAGNGQSTRPTLSSDGRYVQFKSGANNLVTGDTNNADDVFVHDRLTGTTIRVSVNTAGDQTVGPGPNSLRASVSHDGRYVAFVSRADDLVANDTNLSKDIFVRDRQNGTTIRVSVDVNGVEGNGRSDRPSISGDGRFISFYSDADNLIPDDEPGFDANLCPDCPGVRDIFVYDRDPDENGVLDEGNHTVERVSISTTGDPANGLSSEPWISSDGRFVTFRSNADNLVANDTNLVVDIFVRDRLLGTTTRVNVHSSGAQAMNRDSETPSISDDGRYVAFRSKADNLVDGDLPTAHSTSCPECPGFADIFVHDRDPDINGIFDEGNGTTQRVSVSSAGAVADATSDRPWISGNGRYVGYISEATNLVSGDTNAHTDVFVRDLQINTTVRVSIDSLGNQGNAGTDRVTLSDDGRFVAMRSKADNLIVGDDPSFDANKCPTCVGERDVFVHDRDPDQNGVYDEGNGVTTRVSVSTGGVAGNRETGGPKFSGDGLVVAMVGPASNLVAGDTNFSEDVFSHVRSTGVTERVSVSSSETQASTPISFAPDNDDAAMSADGRFIAYRSFGVNFAQRDSNKDADIYLHDRDPDEDGIFDESEAIETRRVNISTFGVEANFPSGGTEISADGTYITFYSDATNLVASDNNTNRDVFLYTQPNCSNHAECDDGLFCNGIEICGVNQTCEQGSNPCPGQGCDESIDLCTAILCEPPIVWASGCRYIDITPAPGNGPVALLVKGNAGDPNVSCISLYVQADGVLGVTPLYQTPEAWGVIHAYGSQVHPSSTYDIQADCGKTSGDVVSSVVSATTWKWGDANNSLSSDISDILRVVDGFLGLFVRHAFPCTSDADCQDPINSPFFECDVVEGFCVSGTTQSLDFIDFPAIETNCLPNRIVNIVDVLASVDAWLGDAFPCSSVCP